MVGQERLHTHHGAGVAVAVRRGDFGLAPGVGLGVGHVNRWIADGAGGDGTGGRFKRYVAGRGHQFRDAREVLGIHADVEVRPQGFGDLLPEERAERDAADAPHHLADEMALRDGVVAAGGAGRPPRRLRGEQRCGALPVVNVLDRHRLFPTGEPGAVAHQVPHLHGRLAGLRELRPVLRHRRPEIQLAAVCQQQGGQRRHGLGGGIDVDDGVFQPRLALGGVAAAGPEIDGELAFHCEGEGGAHVSMFGEVALELLPHRREALVAHAMYFQDNRSRGVEVLPRYHNDEGAAWRVCIG